MEDDMLERILKYYFNSRDFNGLPLLGNAPENDKESAVRLMEDGLVQVVSDDDYPNPHIRPWPSKRSLESQIESVTSLKSSSPSVVLYPTPKALKSYRKKKRYPGMPYRQEMGRGKGTLELAFFRSDVLEQYRNDPRYQFSYWDFGASMGIGDEAYDDPKEPEGDKTHNLHMGFAYDLTDFKPDDPESPIKRLVASFYGDLADLSATHQQRWKTYQVEGDDIEPHPAWWMSQMGHFPDGIGPFEKLFSELENINSLYQNAFGKPLFKTSDRPNDFGWILRPSQSEWDSFIHEMDKVISENIDHKALTAAGIPRKDPSGKDSGSITRLDGFLQRTGLSPENTKSLLKPFREVRLARTKPAHKLRKNITDKTFVHKQIHLIGDINNSLHRIRTWLQKHPANKSWKPKHDTDKGYRM